MARYRKIPVTVEAHQWDPSTKRTAAPDWLRGILRGRPELFDPCTGTLLIEALGGNIIASPGDWIIRGSNGEIYLCKPDAFLATYEPLKKETQP